MGSVTSPSSSMDVKSICIIGAGPSGLSFCKYLKAECAFPKIDVYESMTEVGGAWNYSPVTSNTLSEAPQTNPHVPLDEPIWRNGEPVFPTPMYDSLRTNIPKMIMQYSDKPFSDDDELFPSREVVQQYLVEYSQEIREHIQFSTQVRRVELQQNHGRDQWAVTTRELMSGTETTILYDAVVVGNGHYTVPYIPEIKGLEAWSKAYSGAIKHSKFYKSPDVYKGKKVVCVGNAASGADIGSQLAAVSKQPLLWSIRTPSDTFGHDERLEVPQIVEFLIQDRAVRFEDGRVEKDIDAVVFCTGYLYSFPFLDSLKPPLITDGRRVRGVYKQLFHIAHPSLVFPSLAQKILPFPMSEFQAAAVAKVWSGQLSLPPRADMEDWETRNVEEKGEGTRFHVFEKGGDAEYAEDWVKQIGNVKPPGKGKPIKMWDDKFLWVRSNFGQIRLDYAKHIGVKSLEALGWDYEAQKRQEAEKEAEQAV